MDVSLNWLSATLGRPLDPADTAARIVASCVPVDAVEPVHQDLGQVLIALVEKVEKHPNADRLSLCVVNDGTKTVQVVCGAPNVTAGKKYPYAPVGTTLPGGLTLTARKIRGMESQGMLCSAKELNLGADQDGILELNTDAAPGARLIDAIPYADHRLILDVTPNRPDLLGHRGVARELAASFGAVLKLAAIPGSSAEGLPPRRAERRGTVAGAEIAIDDPGGCPRYAAAVIRGVKVGPSPAWLEARLRAVGARPINNVVDATNYILFELNQPVHAFDLGKLRGPRVIIRRSAPGERLKTLDGVDRALPTGTTTICDAERPVAIGGVMGGAESEVSDTTTDILLECAYFDPQRIRAARKSLKMSTEASYRYERGIDPQAVAANIRRAVALLMAVAGGREDEAPIDLLPAPLGVTTVFLRPERVERVLGVSIAPQEIERILTSVGFAVAPRDGRMAVQVPGWRPDVTAEVDLIEEVARLTGYDAFPTELRPFRPSSVPDDPIEPLKARIRRVLQQHGLHEARSLSLGSNTGPGVQAVINPLSADEAHLRTELLPGLHAAVTRNWGARERDIRLFEIGVVFEAAGPGQLPKERWRVAGVVTGSRTPPHWSQPETPPFDIWDVKGILESVTRVALPAATLEPVDGGWGVRDASGAVRGRADERRLKAPPWASPVFGFELDMEVGSLAAVRYRALPVTPPVERDLSLVLKDGVSAAAVEAVLRREGGALLDTVAVFDEYRAQDRAGRSVGWRLLFRAPDRTLRDEEVDAVLSRVLSALRREMGVELRQA